MVFWGAVVEPGVPFKRGPEDECGNEWSRIHLSQATLGLDGNDKGRTVVKCSVGGGPELLLCSLTPGVSESCSLDLLFDDDVVFSVSGSTSVHLVGYYLPAEEDEEDSDYEADEMESDDDSDEDYENEIARLDASLDDELEFDSEFDSEYDSEFDEDDYDEVPPETCVTLVELDDEGNQMKSETLMIDNVPPRRRKKAGAKDHLSIEAPKRDSAVMEDDSEDEDGFPLPANKKQALTMPESGDATPAETTADPSAEADQSKKESKKQEKLDKRDKKKKEKRDKKNKKKEKKALETEMMDLVENAGLKENGSHEAAGVEMAPEKIGLDEVALAKTAAENVIPTKQKKSKKAGSAIRKFPNGLEIEQISMGKPDARRSKPGKMLTVHYTGRLQSNGKIFDSTVGKKPFKFRLGTGEVIKGWDVGLEGTRVGDKRKVTVPPAMGCGARGAPGTVPGNSWLVFDVEVVDAAK